MGINVIAVLKFNSRVKTAAEVEIYQPVSIIFRTPRSARITGHSGSIWGRLLISLLLFHPQLGWTEKSIQSKQPQELFSFGMCFNTRWWTLMNLLPMRIPLTATWSVCRAPFRWMLRQQRCVKPKQPVWTPVDTRRRLQAWEKRSERERVEEGYLEGNAVLVRDKSLQKVERKKSVVLSAMNARFLRIHRFHWSIWCEIRIVERKKNQSKAHENLSASTLGCK